MGNWTDPGLKIAPNPAPDLMQLVPIPYVLWPEGNPKEFRSFVAAVIRNEVETRRERSVLPDRDQER